MTLTKKEKVLMVKWFKEALDNVTEDERFTMRRSLNGSCGMKMKVAFMVTSSQKHLDEIDRALPPACKVEHDWLAREEVE